MSKKALTLSIIIPVYNEQEYLDRCLSSIAEQTQSPDEVIVVDNGSTDNTLKIAKKYSFVTILNEPKIGVLNARTKGFNHAKSDIIGRIDADSILEKNWCKQVKKIFEDKRVGAITGPVTYYDMPLEKLGHKIDHSIRKMIKMLNNNYPFLLGTNMAIRSSIWQSYKDDFCISKDVHEDMDIAIHLNLANVPIRYEPTMISGMSARRFDDTPKDFYKYIAMQKSTFKKHGIESSTPKIGMATYIFAYFLLKPVRVMYDTENFRLSFKALKNRKIARKNPMD